MAGARYVIGVGNRDRGDDGVGPVVAEGLRQRLGNGFEVLAHDGEVASLLELLEGAERAYCIDAAASGAAPGTVHRLDAAAGPLPRSLFSLSTHGLGLAEAVELARAMGSLPATCVIYAVEAATCEAGQPLSAAVAAAAEEVTDRIRSELAGREQQE